MSNEVHRAGITPLTLREAAHYASMGVGSYAPKGYSWFDRVEVVVGLPWTANTENPLASTMVLRVEFYRGPRRARFIDFSLIPSGFGGDPILREV